MREGNSCPSPGTEAGSVRSYLSQWEQCITSVRGHGAHGEADENWQRSPWGESTHPWEKLLPVFPLVSILPFGNRIEMSSFVKISQRLLCERKRCHKGQGDGYFVCTLKMGNLNLEFTGGFQEGNEP